MTTTIREETRNGYYIGVDLTMRYDHPVYHVIIARDFGDYVGYPVRESWTPSRSNAMATYRRYSKSI